jgi:hypothetical protein
MPEAAAEVIFHNGRFTKLDRSLPRADAVLVRALDCKKSAFRVTILVTPYRAAAVVRKRQKLINPIIALTGRAGSRCAESSVQKL